MSSRTNVHRPRRAPDPRRKALAVKRRAARDQAAVRTLAAFVRRTWHVVEPGVPLTWGWHLDVLCAELEAWCRRGFYGKPVLVRGSGWQYAHTTEDDPDAVWVPVRDLVISIPPGSLKSLLVSVFLPAWRWLHAPEWRLLALANDPKLAVRDSQRSRAIIRSTVYRRLVQVACTMQVDGLWFEDPSARRPPDSPNREADDADLDRQIGEAEDPDEVLALQRRREVVAASLEVLAATGPDALNAPPPAIPGSLPDRPWEIIKDQDEKHWYANTSGGFRQSLSINAKITGKRADDILIDDPYDVKEVLKGSARKVAERMGAIVDVANQVLPSRLNDLRSGGILLIMQRIHEHDLAGVFLSRPGVRAVVISAEYDPASPYNHPNDPRTEPGELFFEARFPAHVLEVQRIKLGPRQYAAQYLQVPTPDVGGLFKRAAMSRYHDAHPRRLSFDEVVISVDAAFKGDDGTADLEGRSYVVLLVVGRIGRTYYPADMVRDRMDFYETVEALRLVMAKWPEARTKLIEDKANGPAIVSTLQRETIGVTPVNPEGGKESRAQVSAAAFRGRNVLLPKPEVAPWVGDFVEEHVRFGPGCAYDDIVDAFSQAIAWFEGDAPVDAKARAEAQLEAAKAAKGRGRNRKPRKPLIPRSGRKPRGEGAEVITLFANGDGDLRALDPPSGDHPLPAEPRLEVGPHLRVCADAGVVVDPHDERPVDARDPRRGVGGCRLLAA